jgi:hypothetical protein
MVIPVQESESNRGKGVAHAKPTSVKANQIPCTLPIVLYVAGVIPSFWQPLVSGSVLQSHHRNAWLARLIPGGSIQGLWIGHQSTNFLAFILLSLLPKDLGVSAAERVPPTNQVLVFFCGAFHFDSSISRGLLASALAWYRPLQHGIPIATDGLLPLIRRSFLVICRLTAVVPGGADVMGYASTPSVFSSASPARLLDNVLSDLLPACSAVAGSFRVPPF